MVAWVPLTTDKLQTTESLLSLAAHLSIDNSSKPSHNITYTYHTPGCDIYSLYNYLLNWVVAATVHTHIQT